MKVLQDIIVPHQSGFLKGRHLTNSIWKVINIINFGKQVDTPIMAIFVDTEKAFDRVEWVVFFYIREIKNGFLLHPMDKTFMC